MAHQWWVQRSRMWIIDGCWSGVEFVAVYSTQSACLSAANRPDLRPSQSTHSFCCIPSVRVALSFRSVLSTQQTLYWQGWPRWRGAVLQIAALRGSVCDFHNGPMRGALAVTKPTTASSLGGSSTARSALLSRQKWSETLAWAASCTSGSTPHMTSGTACVCTEYIEKWNTVVDIRFDDIWVFVQP